MGMNTSLRDQLAKAFQPTAEIVSANVKGPVENWTPGCECSWCRQAFTGPSWLVHYSRAIAGESLTRGTFGACCSEACANATAVSYVVGSWP